MARAKRGVVKVEQNTKKSFKICKRSVWKKKKYHQNSSTGHGKSNAICLPRQKSKKREFRSLWIQRINAGVRAEGLTYAKL